MKYKNLLIKSVDLLLILLILAAYQVVLYTRSQREEITELKTQINQLEGEQEEIMTAIRENSLDVIADEAGESEQIQYKDGVYAGTGEGFGGPVNVEVKVEKGRIATVSISEAGGEDEAYLSIASQILDNIVEKQTADVDVISGASYSSQGIIDAVKDALKAAGD